MKFLIVLALIGFAAADLNPLSADEAALLQNTWKQISHDEIDIVYSVFKAYPDIQTKFAAFVGKDLEDIKTTAPFALHATRIVSFLNEVIALSGVPEALPAVKTLVNELGHNHKNRGITKAQFNELRTALTNYIKTRASWGDNVDAAWNKGLDNIYFIIFSNLDGHPVV